jgi:hypothetical protein
MDYKLPKIMPIVCAVTETGVEKWTMIGVSVRRDKTTHRAADDDNEKKGTNVFMIPFQRQIPGSCVTEGNSKPCDMDLKICLVLSATYLLSPVY